MIFAVATVSSFALVSAAWGYASSWLAEVIKQDGWPKPLNTVISDLLLIGSAALATLTDSTFSVHNVGAAVLFAALAAMANRQLFLEPTGVGPALKTATSVLKPDPAADRRREIRQLAEQAAKLGLKLYRETVVPPSTRPVAEPDADASAHLPLDTAGD